MNDKLEHSQIKQGLELLLKNLFENKLIFHERVTILCELVKYELKEDRFSVELKAIKPLVNESEGQNRMYQHITSKPTFTVWSTYTLGNYKIFDGKKIGMPYCPFLIFADSAVVENVCKLSGEELVKSISDLMWS